MQTEVLGAEGQDLFSPCGGTHSATAQAGSGRRPGPRGTGPTCSTSSAAARSNRYQADVTMRIRLWRCAASVPVNREGCLRQITVVTRESVCLAHQAQQQGRSKALLLRNNRFFMHYPYHARLACVMLLRCYFGVDHWF